MSKLSNIVKMMFILRKGDIVSRKDLAKELDVTEKQIGIYKSVLDEVFTIESIPGPHGGYKLIDTYFPFKEVLNKEEIFNLKILIDKLDYDNQENAKLKQLVEKINFSLESLNNNQCTDIIAYSRKNPEYKNEKLELDIYNAILQGDVVIIEYVDNQNQTTRRAVQPYKYFIYRGEVYLVAYCLSRNAIRFFKIVRIKECIITSKKFKKIIDVDKEIKEMQEQGIGIFGLEEYEVELEIRPPMANSIKERIWVENQIIEELDDGSIIFKAKMKGEHSIVSWILTMREFVKIKKPDKLKNIILDSIERIYKNHKI